MLPRHLFKPSHRCHTNAQFLSWHSPFKSRTAREFLSLIFQYLKISSVFFFQTTPPSNIIKRFFRSLCPIRLKFLIQKVCIKVHRDIVLASMYVLYVVKKFVKVTWPVHQLGFLLSSLLLRKMVYCLANSNFALRNIL
jgi:hypothetical protein